MAWTEHECCCGATFEGQADTKHCFPCRMYGCAMCQRAKSRSMAMISERRLAEWTPIPGPPYWAPTAAS